MLIGRPESYWNGFRSFSGVVIRDDGVWLTYGVDSVCGDGVYPDGELVVVMAILNPPPSTVFAELYAAYGVEAVAVWGMSVRRSLFGRCSSKAGTGLRLIEPLLPELPIVACELPRERDVLFTAIEDG